MVNLDNFRPADVPGYAAAKTAGLTPAQPTTAPKPLPGLNAKQILAVLGGSAAALFMFAVVSSNFPDNVPVFRLLVPLVMIGGLIPIVVLALKLKGRVYQELQQGYTTTQMQFGRGHKGRWRQETVGGNHLAWDYSSVWILDIKGNVVREPLTHLDGPGFYPSPTEEGRFELWTGVSWSGLMAKDS